MKNPNRNPGRPPQLTSSAELNVKRAEEWRAKYDKWKAWEAANPQPLCPTCEKPLTQLDRRKEKV